MTHFLPTSSATACQAALEMRCVVGFKSLGVVFILCNTVIKIAIDVAKYHLSELRLTSPPTPPANYPGMKQPWWPMLE